MLHSFIYFLVIGSLTGNYATAQQYHYVSTTADHAHDITVTKKKKSGTDVLTLEEYKLYSQHVFQPTVGTRQWTLRDDKVDHNFVAKRVNNTIHISGSFHGKPVEKTVKIDEDVWYNKLDHGLSAFAVSDQKELSFWVLKLLSDMDPIKMTAEKEGTERIRVGEQTYDAVKVKLTLNHFILSKLWSARCWYRASDGLFLRYEGANGRPGTPVTIIEIQGKTTSLKSAN